MLHNRTVVEGILLKHQKDLHMGIRTSIVASVLVGLVMGCTKKGEDVEVPVYSVIISETAANGDPTCKCQDAKGIYITNTDPDYMRYGKYNIVTKVGGTTTKTKDISYLAAKGTAKLGCSIHPNSGEGAPICVQNTKYDVYEQARLMPSTVAKTEAFGPLFAPDVATCSEVCDQPNNPMCFRLSSTFGKAAIAPFTDLITGIYDTGDGVITSAQSQSKYGIDSQKDTCQRGDTIIKNGVATNEAPDHCDISTKSFAPLLALAGVPVTTLHLRPKLTALKIASPAIIKNQNGRHVRLTSNAESAHIKFEGPGSDAINREFGGDIITISSFETHTVFATSNGCIRADK